MSQFPTGSRPLPHRVAALRRSDGDATPSCFGLRIPRVEDCDPERPKISDVSCHERKAANFGRSSEKGIDRADRGPDAFCTVHDDAPRLGDHPIDGDRSVLEPNSKIVVKPSPQAFATSAFRHVLDPQPYLGE